VHTQYIGAGAGAKHDELELDRFKDLSTRMKSEAMSPAEQSS